MICDKFGECIEAQLKDSSLKQCANRNSGECIEVSDNRPSVKCEERKKKYVLDNTEKNHVILYKMDGGVIVEDKTVMQGTNKCDYLFVIGGVDKRAILTELKGVDVPKSLEQLKGTLSQYASVFRGFKQVYARVIVTSSTPTLKATPAYVNLERLVRQQYHGNVKIEERQFREKDTELDKI